MGGSRRGNGEGSQPFKAPNGTWRGQIWITYANGERKRRDVRGRSAQEVRAKYKELLRQSRAGVLPRDAQRASTVRSYCEDWLARSERDGMKASAMKDAAGVFRNYVIPAVGSLKLADVTAEDVHRIMAGEVLRSRTPRTQQKVRTVVSTLFLTAEREGLIASSPVRRVKSPSVAAHSPATRAFSEGQMDDLLRYAHGKGAETELRVLVALMGLRAAEALALSWDDIDKVEMRIEIKAARTREKYEHGALCRSRIDHTAARCPARVQARLLQPPKSKAGHRFVPLSPQLLPLLDATREMQLARARRHKDAVPHPELPDPLFKAPDGVSPLSVTTDSIRWRAMLDALGLPKGFNLHTARHTAATRMLTGPQRTDVATVGAVLGHSSMRSTAAYLHADLETSRRAVNGYLAPFVGEEAEIRRSRRQFLEARLASVASEIQELKDQGVAPKYFKASVEDAPYLPPEGKLYFLVRQWWMIQDELHAAPSSGFGVGDQHQPTREEIFASWERNWGA